MATRQSSVNLGSVFYPVRSLMGLAGEAVAKVVGKTHNFAIIDLLPMHIVSSVVEEFSADTVFEYLRDREEEKIARIASYTAESQDVFMFCAIYFQLGEVKGISRNSEAADIQVRLLVMVCNFWMLYTSNHFLAVLDAMGLMHKMKKLYATKFCPIRASGEKSVAGLFNDSQPFLNYLQVKHNVLNLPSVRMVPKVLWNPTERQSVSWQNRKRPARIVETLEQIVSNWETPVSVAAPNYWRWLDTMDFGHDEEESKFVRLGCHGSMAFITVVIEARGQHQQNHHSLALGHLVQAFSYFTATEEGRTGTRFTREVLSMRLDLYLLLACCVSKFGGGGCSTTCRALLAKACSLLKTTCGGSNIRDIRHPQVLLAAQEVAFSKGWMYKEEALYEELLCLPYLAHNSSYLFVSSLIHVRSLLERVENCLSYLCTVYRRNCQAREESTLWGVIKMEDYGRELLEDARVISHDVLECPCNKALAQSWDIQVIRKQLLLYDLLLFSFISCTHNTPSVKAKFDALMSAFPATSNFEDLLYGMFMSTGTVSLSHFRHWERLERTVLAKTVEVAARADALFRHTVTVVASTLICRQGPELYISDMTAAIEALRAVNPGHHRLRVFEFFNSRTFEDKTQMLSLANFPASTFVPPNHPLRTEMRLFDVCWCRKSFCQCFEVQATAAKTWAKQESTVVLPNRDLVKMVLKTSAFSQMAELSRLYKP